MITGLKGSFINEKVFIIEIFSTTLPKQHTSRCFCYDFNDGFGIEIEPHLLKCKAIR
jgi:hypothetical protein